VVHADNALAVRASTGELWVPHLATNMDAFEKFLETTNNPTGCRVEKVYDDSTFDLVLSRAPLDGGDIVPVLNLPNLTATTYGASGAMDAQAYGDEMVVLVRILSPGVTGRFRLLVIDTTLL